MTEESARTAGIDDVELDQIVERLRWTPKERLQYLLETLAFEDRTREVRPVSRRS